MHRNLSAVAACFALTLATPAFTQYIPLPYYVKSAAAVDVQLGTVKESEGRDINDEGDIVGWAVNSAGDMRAFLYQYSFMWDISPTAYNVSSASAAGINNSGEVVGNFADGGFWKPFYWHLSSGAVELSHALFPGKSWEDSFILYPHAINDSGRIVGFAEGLQLGPNPAPLDGCHENISLQWADRFANPKRLFCNSDIWINYGAADVNNSGEIAGSSQSSHNEGYVWSGGQRIDVPPLAGGHEVKIFGINEAGKVVGSDSGYHAILWDRASANSMDLGHLASGNRAEAYEINDLDFVGGYSTINAIDAGNTVERKERAFLWHDDFGMYRLPIPPNFTSSTDCRANSLNNRDSGSGLIQLAGYCTKNGKRRAVRWDVTVMRGLVIGPAGP